MLGDQHHRSKKVRYDLVLVPRDDAGLAKSIRFSPWQVYLILLTAVVLVAVIVLAVLAYTPVGALIPIENPELVNRYTKELLASNQRMNSVMQQLVELREYNVKLRKAFGEQVIATDSGVAVVGSPRTARVERGRRLEGGEGTLGTVQMPTSRPILTRTVEEPAIRQQYVVFPVILPAEGYITRGFEAEQRHYGLDIAGKSGSLVSAAADGHVVFADWTSDDGYKVILSHPGGFLTFYKHNQSLLRSAPAFVRRGEPIALLGNSGQTSKGPHVHFEIWKDGVPVDPANYILNLNF